MAILTQLKILYLLLLSPLIFLFSFAVLGLGWAFFIGNRTDQWHKDVWVYRVIYILSILITVGLIILFI